MSTKKKSKAQDLSWKPKRPFAERDGGLLMTPEEAADVLGTTERHIWRLIRQGELPKVKIGDKVRVHKDDVAAYVEQQRIPAER